LTHYDNKPERFLKRLYQQVETTPYAELICAGFEAKEWRCGAFAFHLAQWLPEYALPEEELRFTHGNSLEKIRAAAVRVYTSEKYKTRGEAGEIALHAICRDFYNTIPISPRVFYKSSSNDVVKAFDLVHARFPEDGNVEIWLGESKFYADSGAAIASAIRSITAHLDRGFLTNQKILLGPQIPRTVPRYDEIRALFKSQTSLDDLLSNASFVIGVLSDSAAVKASSNADPSYLASAQAELEALASRLTAAGFGKGIRFLIFYVPLASKDALAKAFDDRLKGLQ